MATLTAFPASHIAGDTLRVERPSYADAPVGAGWTVTLTLLDIEGAVVEATATEEGTLWTFTVAAEDWSALTAGPVALTVRGSKSGEVVTLERATLLLAADPTVSGTGATSKFAHVERVIAACEARLEGKITDDVQMYQLPDGVTVSKLTLREVRELLAQYQAKRSRMLRGGRPRVREVWYGFRG